MDSRSRLGSYGRKVDLLRAILQTHRKDSLCLSSQVATTWLTGARSFINLAVEASCFKVVVTPDQVYIVVNNIEAARLMEEEMDGLPVEVRSHLWYESERIPERVMPEAQFADWLRAQQYLLDPYEQDVLQKLSEDVGISVAQVMKSFSSGIRELDLAAELNAALIRRNIEPVVTLVAGDERTKLRRHPLPTDNRIQRYALAAVCGRRHGLIASVTRSVSFVPLSEKVAARHDCAAYVDAIAISSTKPGNTLGEVLERMQRAYADRGFADEWQLHHQGGITGYYTRASLAKPGLSDLLQPGMAIAWNPSVHGTKTEDTCLLGKEKAQILTMSPEHWPTKDYTTPDGIIKRPEIFVR